MKIFYILATLLLGSALAASTELKEAEVHAVDVQLQEAELKTSIIGQFINATLNRLLANLPDPKKFDPAYNEYNNVIFTGWLESSESEISGLRSIVSNDIDVTYRITSASSINLTLTAQSLNLFLNYDTQLIIGQLLPFFGKGDFSAILDSIKVHMYTLANVVLRPTIGITGFRNTTISFSIGEDTSLEIQGVYYSDDVSRLVNQAINTVLSRAIVLINKYQDEISKIISPILESYLDDIFK